MPPAPVQGTNGTAAPVSGGPLAEGTLSMPMATLGGKGQAVLTSSTPARTATASNVTKLQTITAPSNTDTNLYAKPGEDYATYEARVGAYKTANTPTDTKTTTTTPTPPVDPANNPTPPTQPATDTSTKDPYDAAVKGVSDPGLAAQFKTYLQTQDQEISQAQSNIDTIKQRSLNDPAVTGIVNSIKAKYDQQIALMRAKNNQLMGKANTSVAAFGGLGMMGQSFLSDQQSRADDRIQTIQNEEDAAIAKAQAAYLTQNYKDLNEAMTAYDKANADKLKALNDLLTASSKSVEQAQKEQKLELQATKDALAKDVTTSTKIAAGVAANIKAAGLTDPTQIMSYVKGLADQYDISNPDILYSQVVSAQQTAAKTEASLANTQNTIENRNVSTAIKVKNSNKPKPAPKPAKKTLADQVDEAWSTIDQLAQPGVKTKEGVPYMVKAANGNDYFTAKGFQTLLAAARSSHITRLQFIQQHADKFQPGMADNYGLTPAEATKIGI
jgi:2-oxo-4-hydroxy-4-carboxy--5-ureidoimidazoline (OHCU) decarboxylase